MPRALSTRQLAGKYFGAGSMFPLSEALGGKLQAAARWNANRAKSIER